MLLCGAGVAFIKNRKSLTYNEPNSRAIYKFLKKFFRVKNPPLLLFMQEVDFFRTPFFLFKADKNFAEKISDEIRDILKEKKKVDYISYGKNKIANKIPVAPLSDLDFNIQTSVGGFLSNNANDYSGVKIENIPSKILEIVDSYSIGSLLATSRVKEI